MAAAGCGNKSTHIICTNQHTQSSKHHTSLRLVVATPPSLAGSELFSPPSSPAGCWRASLFLRYLRTQRHPHRSKSEPSNIPLISHKDTIELIIDLQSALQDYLILASLNQVCHSTLHTVD